MNENNAHRRILDEHHVASDALVQFRLWFREALEAQIPLADAAALATSTRDGKPSARMVLVKSADDRGLVFYTNFHSRKGKELAENPRAAILFHWKELERQVRIEGSVEQLTPEESDAYFQTRPKESQISAVISPQSEILKSREELELAAEEFRKRSGDRPIACPTFWGGYRLVPHSVEFWQGRPARLHDRILYTRKPDGSWTIVRLAP